MIGWKFAAGAVAIAAALGATALAASAQERYPGKPVKVLLPLPPGGGLDTLTRMITERVSLAFGQPVLVENRPGANGMIAAGAAVKAPADGYTLLFSQVSGRITDLGYDVAASGAGEFAQLVRSEADRWAALVKEFRISAN